MDEQIEAKIVTELNKQSNFAVKSPVFIAKREIYDILVDKGMPTESASLVVGRMHFMVDKDPQEDNEDYEFLEKVAASIFKLWKDCKKVMSESVFLESAYGLGYIPAVIDKKERKDFPFFSIKSPTFVAKKELFDMFIELGMPKDVAGDVVGRMKFAVKEDPEKNAIHYKLMEITAENIFNLWKAYQEELDVRAFVESAYSFGFTPAFISIEVDGEEEK